MIANVILYMESQGKKEYNFDINEKNICTCIAFNSTLSSKLKTKCFMKSKEGIYSHVHEAVSLRQMQNLSNLRKGSEDRRNSNERLV